MSELEIQENMSAEEAFMDTESAYEEIPEAFQKLAQLLGQDQFELLFPDKDAENQDEIRLVYLMNDAVESFLVFIGARMTGHYQKDYEGELDATLSQEDGEYVLVVYQGETVVTIFFRDLQLEVNLYNYGDVGNINLLFFCAPACLPRIFTTSGQHCQNQCDTKHRLQIFSINHVSPFRHPEFGLYTGFHFLLPHSKTAHPLHISAAVWSVHSPLHIRVPYPGSIFSPPESDARLRH